MICTFTCVWIWLGWIAMIPVGAQQPRIWRDNTGTFDVLAVLVSEGEDSVVLQLTDGRTVTVPLRRLSVEDAGYLQQRRAEKREIKKLTENGNSAVPDNLPPADAREPESSMIPGSLLIAGDFKASAARSKILKLEIAPWFFGSDDPPLEFVRIEPLSYLLEPEVSLEPVREQPPMPRLAEPNASESLTLIGPSPIKNGDPDSGRPGEVQSRLLGIAAFGSSSDPANQWTSGSVNEFGIIALETLSDQAEPRDSASALGDAGNAGDESGRPTWQPALDDLLAEIRKTTDGLLLRRQLVRLARLPVPMNDGPTLDALRPHLRVKDNFVRESVFQKMIDLSDPPDVEMIRLALEDDSLAIRWKAYELLRVNPHPELVPLLVERMQQQDRSKIIDTLGAYGDRLEPLLWPLLESDNAGVRMEVLKLLSGIGTARSVPVLTGIAEKPDRAGAEVRQANSSILSIEKRR